MAPSLSRNSIGRLAAFSSAGVVGISDTFDLADWDAPTGVTLSLASGALRANGNVTQGRITLNAIANRAAVMVQATVISPSLAGAGVCARVVAAAFPNTSVDIRSPMGFTGTEGIYEVSGGAAVQSSTVGSVNRTLPRMFTLALDGTNADARAGAQSYALTGLGLTGAGRVAVYHSGSASTQTTYAEFYAMASRYLTVLDVPIGYTVQVLSASDVVLASAVAASSTVLVDMIGVTFPNARKVRVLNASLVVQATATPAQAVWGGDEWRFVIAPDKPSAPTVDAATATTLRIEWTAAPRATSYRLLRGVAPGGPYTEVYDGPALTFTDSGLTALTHYYYVLEAYNSDGPSPLSDELAAITAASLYPPCTIVLDVFEADGETVAWSVATDPAHPFPYLDRPGNYGAAEADPVAGAVTISTVDVTVRDVPAVAGDQDSGFVTARLDDIHGRRCRLRRFVDDVLEFSLIADGPAGVPRLNDDFSSYSWGIRDVRDTERKLQPFATGGVLSVFPWGPMQDWGDTGSGFLLTAAPAIEAEVDAFVSGSLQYVVLRPGLTDPLNSLTPAQIAALETINNPQNFGGAFWAELDILWREAGSSGPWNLVRPTAVGGFSAGMLAYEPIPAHHADHFRITSIIVGFVPVAEFAANGETVELNVRYRGAPTAQFPYYYEGTLGDLLTKLYSRELERPALPGGFVWDPYGLDSGDALPVVPHDATALASLTTPIVLRLTAPVEDGRDWAEKTLYAPAGYFPALDADGAISPQTRNRPAVTPSAHITAADAEPAPSWNAGERLVSEVTLSGFRYFVPASADVEVGADGIAARVVRLRFVDIESQARFGTNAETFDAAAFSSVGDEDGAELGTETIATLAADAETHVLERYRLGARAIVVRVRRSAFPTLRVGDFVRVTLGWLPGVGSRGLAWDAAQVLSLSVDDCAWCTVLLEQCPVMGS